MYKKVADLLASDRQLADIHKHISKLSALQNRLRQELKPPVNQHVIVANFDAKTLLIHTDSANWAAKLRFMIPELLDIVKNHCEVPTISTIRIKIVIPKTTQHAANHAMQDLSKENAAYLQTLAATTDDARLAKVLIRLAQHNPPQKDTGK